jgi:hypothetical protein
MYELCAHCTVVYCVRTACIPDEGSETNLIKRRNYSPNLCHLVLLKYSFHFVVLPSSAYLFTVGVEGFYFHLITLKHTPQSIGLLLTRDRPVAETST